MDGLKEILFGALIGIAVGIFLLLLAALISVL
jgi:hypothetical protein